jgi:uncharacterized protein
VTRAAGALALVLLATAVAAAADVPYLTGRVVDNAEILSTDARARLTAALKAHEEATGNQIAVLTVRTIQPQSIEDYAVEVFKSWKLGQKEKNNGVLVVIVPQDRRMRIEVGYGLEPVLTDATAGAIIRDVMTPAFKRGDYDAGVSAGVAAIVARLEGKPDAAVAPSASRPAARARQNFPSGASMPWPQRILFSLFVFSMLGMFTTIGIVTPGMGWFLYVFLIPFWSMFPMMLIGAIPTLVLVAVYLIGYPLAKLRVKRTAWYAKAETDLRTKGTASIGGFALASGGGGFSSGGGFSGGGGSSGGGGASGSW